MAERIGGGGGEAFRTSRLSPDLRDVQAPGSPLALGATGSIPGGTSSLTMLSGMEGVLSSNKAAVLELKNAGDILKVQAESMLRMTNSLDRAVTAQQQIASQITAAVSSLTGSITAPTMPTIAGMPLPGAVPSPAAPTGHPSGPAAQPVPVSPSLNSSQTAARTGTGNLHPVSAPTGVPTAHDEEPPPSNYDRFSSGRQYSVGRLRTDAAHAISQRVSGITLGQNIRTRDDGSFERFDPNTNEGIGDATSHDIRNMNIANRVRNVGGRVADQGVAKGLINSLPADAGKFLGVAGAAYALTDYGLNQAEDQREKNSEWQSITGDTNASGFGNRLRGYGFRLSQRGVMNGQQADQLYKGVAETGYIDSGERGDALDFATENWRKFGMSINDSITLLQTSADHGLKSLDGLSTSLDDVTKAAKDAGMNADEVRKSFENLYAASAGQLQGQGTAASVSGAVSSAQAALGDKYKSLNFAPSTSTNTLGLIAAQNGQTLAQFMGSNSGTAGAARITGYTQQAERDAAMRIGGQRLIQFIAQWKTEQGIDTSTRLTPDQVEELSTEVLQELGIDPRGVQAALAPYVSIPDINQAIPTLINILDGEFNPAGNANGNLKDSSLTKVTPSASKASKNTTSGIQGSTTGGSYASGYAGVGGSSMYGARNGVGAGYVSPLESAYSAYTAKTGTSSPIVQKLVGSTDASKMTFKINTGTAEKPNYRTLSAADAVKYAPDQLARGDVEIVSGKGAGQTVGDYEGYKENDDIKVDYSTAQKASKLGKEQETGAVNSPTDPTQQYMIGLTDEAKRLFKISSPTSAPPSSVSTPSGYASGNY